MADVPASPVPFGWLSLIEDLSVRFVLVLPRMVRLSARTATGELSWLVSIPAHLQPPQLLRIEASGFGL